MALSNYRALGMVDLSRLAFARAAMKISGMLSRFSRSGRELDQLIRHAGLHGCTISRDGGYYLVEAPAALTGMAHQIRLRRGTSDLAVYFQTILAGEYAPLVEMIGEKAGKISTIVDAGANIGATAVFFSARFPQASIHCIEADQSNFDLLRSNLHLNKLATVHSTHGALWDQDEELVMSSILDGRHWARSVTGVGGQSSGEPSVRAITVPQFLSANQIEVLDLLKMDIEGAEARVLSEKANPSAWLDRTRYLAVEIHGEALRREIEAMLRKREFRVFRSGETTFAANLRLKV